MTAPTSFRESQASIGAPVYVLPVWGSQEQISLSERQEAGLLDLAAQRC